MANLTKGKLKSLYNSGLSIKDISDRENLSYSFVRYWIGKYKIPRRSWSDATYAKRNPDGDPFKVKARLNKKETELKNLGIGIYWGEGDKSPNNTSVRLGNTDPFLIKKFREFLRKVYQVKETKFSYGLILFNDVKEAKATNFWKEYLGIKRKQLGKITIIPPQGKGTYKNKNLNGVLTVYYCNSKLRKWIDNQLCFHS